MSDPKEGIELRRMVHTGRLLGEGGMGRVLDGFAADLGQYFAVKVLLPENCGDAEARARFDEEVAIMAMIDHPGNLPVYGVGTDPAGLPCYVMKKVEGRTLAEVIAERGDEINSVPMRRRLLAILLDACETVGCAHEIGVVHRDLKPENILIDRHDSVYVIDWGIAKRGGDAGSASEATRTLPGRVMGSPGYLAPEQAEGRSASAGPQADVFALGVILYELLTGNRPFGGMGGRAELLGTIHMEPADPRRGNWFLPRSIAAVCLKALAKDPARRYPDARALADDLRAFLEGRPVSARKPNPIERFGFFARRRPLRAALVSSSALAALAVAAFIGAQVVVDLRLSDKALERLEAIEREVEELSAEGDALRTELAADGLQVAERQRLEHDLGIIDSRWLLAELEAQRLLREVYNLRFIRRDPELAQLARERVFLVVETAIERGHLNFAKALIDTLLERQREGALASEFSATDVALLERLAVEADSRSDLSAD